MVSTKVPTSTPKPTSRISDLKDDDEKKKILSQDEYKDNKVLGVEGNTPTSDLETNGNTNKKMPVVAGSLMLVGAGFMGYSAYAFIKNRKKEYNFKDEESEN